LKNGVAAKALVDNGENSKHDADCKFAVTLDECFANFTRQEEVIFGVVVTSIYVTFRAVALW